MSEQAGKQEAKGKGEAQAAPVAQGELGEVGMESWRTSTPPYPEARPPAGKILAALAAIMADVTAVGKDRTNEEQRYSYRGIDDLYNMLHPVFAKHGVYMLPEVTGVEVVETPRGPNQSPRITTTVTLLWHFCHGDGSRLTLPSKGQASEYGGDKGQWKAMTMSQKYLLCYMFLIPTNEQDPDGEPQPDAAPAARQPERPATAMRQASQGAGRGQAPEGPRQAPAAQGGGNPDETQAAPGQISGVMEACLKFYGAAKWPEIKADFLAWATEDPGTKEARITDGDPATLRRGEVARIYAWLQEQKAKRAPAKQAAVKADPKQE